MKRLLFVFFCSLIFSLAALFAEENINSPFDSYYRSLSLTGLFEKPSLGFRSYSTNDWNISDVTHPWEKSDARSSLWENEKLSLDLTPIQVFQSYNLNSPHGINDSGLWQGKGYNMALSGGVSFKSPYVEFTFFPELYFSQNLSYDIQPANSWSGSPYGYPYSGIDNPQRFGDESFWDFGWGQTQVRFNYNDWTVGFGTENFWIGPASKYAIIQTNNAEGYPHIDLGLNKTETALGDLEFRMWWGWLKSSSFYERAESDAYLDYLGGVSFSWDMSFIPGLTMGIHKTTQVDLDEFTFYHIIAPIDPGLISSFKGGEDMGQDGSDGRASVTWSWMAPSIGFEFYGEFALEDYIPSLIHLLRRPDHAAGFVLGVNQNIPIKNHKDKYFVLNAEFASLVWSRDYYLNGIGWGGGFYRHNLTNVGYTNEGQVLGSGFGSGGNGQYIGLDYYAPFGMAGIYLDRKKWDDTAMYSAENINDISPDWDVPVQLAIGVKSHYLINKKWSIGGDLAYVYDVNLAMINSNTYMGLYAGLSLNYRY